MVTEKMILLAKRKASGLLENTALMLLVIVMLAFSAASPFFFMPFNLNNIIVQNAHVLVMITGLIFVMQGGGFDLSVGYQISLVSVVVGYLLSAGIPLFWTICAGVLTGVLCGTFNGSIISVFHISPVIVTLITHELFRGISYMLSGGVSYSDFPKPFRYITNTTVLGFTGVHYITMLSILFAIIVFRYTVFGKIVLAMGYDAHILEKNGIGTKGARILSYVICGFFCSIAAILIVSRQGVASSAIGPGMELKGVMAACIAGVSSNLLAKNHKRVPTVNYYIGVLIMAIIENGMLLTGNNQYVECCITSLIILISVIPGGTVWLKKKKRQ